MRRGVVWRTACAARLTSMAFPLTDVQQAYLVGRRPGFPWAGRLAFRQFEVADLDVAFLRRAMNRLINVTPTPVVQAAQVLREVPRFRCPASGDRSGRRAPCPARALARQVLTLALAVFGIQAAQVVRTRALCSCA